MEGPGGNCDGRKEDKKIATSVGLLVYSLSHCFTVEASRRKQSRLLRNMVCPHTSLPPHSSASVPPHLSASRILLLSDLGGGQWLWHQKREWPKPLAPSPPIAGSSNKKQRLLFLSRGHLSFPWTVWIHTVYLGSLAGSTPAFDFCDQDPRPRRGPCRHPPNPPQALIPTSWRNTKGHVQRQ